MGYQIIERAGLGCNFTRMSELRVLVMAHNFSHERVRDSSVGQSFSPGIDSHLALVASLNTKIIFHMKKVNGELDLLSDLRN